MDKLKNILKSDTPTDESNTGYSSGRVTGQGSHFAGANDAALTAGPERGGSDHVNTTSAGTGSAAIGQTTTYSSSHLQKGDPTSSVIDTESRDPLTYKKPESSHMGDTGVPSGSALGAATRAFSQSNEQSSAGYDNPYRASSLDPRVDGGSKASAVPRESAFGTGTSTGSSLTGLGSSHTREKQYENTAPAPSTLTTTANPVDRSAEYSGATTTRGLDHATPSTTTQPAPTHHTSSSDQTSGQTEDSSMVGRALGAVGLGSVAGALGYGATSHESSAVADTPDRPTTTTGVDSYTAPTYQTGSSQPPTHHRKESIPTTAYPAGIGSPQAINAPVGGTRASIDQGDHHRSGSGTASRVGAIGGVAAVAATGVGASEYQRSSALRENITGQSGGSAPLAVGSGTNQPTRGVPNEQYQQSSVARDNILSGTGSTQQTSGLTSSTGTSHHTSGLTSSTTPTQVVEGITPMHHLTTVDTPTSGAATGSYGASQLGKHTEAPLTGSSLGKHTETPLTGSSLGKHTETPLTGSQLGKHTEVPLRERDHTTRDAALGAGVGAGALGAGAAYGAHEHSQRDAEKAEAQAAKDRAAHQKQIEKDQKAAEKQYEKEEHKHQKELEKQEHKHQKEIEKEEAHRRKAIEEEEEKRRKAAAATAAGATGAAAVGEKEKKPSLFRRIFKRRKNQETGEEEEYSSDEEDTTHHGALAGAGVATGAGVAGATAAHNRTTESTTAGQENFAKPSYNPFSHDDPAKHSTSSTDPLASTPHGNKGFVSENTDGTPKYTVVPTSANTSSVPTSAPVGAGADARGAQPREPITGLPYDPAKDPSTAEVLSHHQHGAGLGGATTAATTHTGSATAGTHPTYGNDGSVTGTGIGNSSTTTGPGFDPIAAGSFKMGELTDKHHGGV